MSEPLDLEPIKARKFSQYAAVDDRLALLVEVERLRAVAARQAEQITAVRELHYEVVVAYERSAGVTHQSECGECGIPWPCPTVEALDGAS